MYQQRREGTAPAWTLAVRRPDASIRRMGPIVAAVAALAAGAVTALACGWRRGPRSAERALAVLLPAAHRLGGGDPAIALPIVLAEAGRALGFDRLELYEVRPAPGSAPDALPAAVWDGPQAWPRPALARERSWHPQRSRWLVELALGRRLAATAANLPPGEVEELEGAGAIAAVPLLAGGRLRGVLLGRDRRARVRGAGDLDALAVLAELVLAAWQRAAAAADLVKATAEARAGARAKDEFLANINHEVRTPLNGVLGMTGLLLDTRLDPEQREFAQVARTSAENLLALLNDLIGLARAEGEVKAERLRLDPLRLAEDVVTVLAERAHAKGIAIAVEPEPSLPRRAVGDAGRLRQVLLNLVGNAIKFTAAGHVLVRAGWDDGSLVYRVSDTGIGVPPEIQERIFAAFTQGDGSSTRRYGGTGLGLAICLRQAEIMGGRVDCESRPGAGATFTLRVPSLEASSSATGRMRGAAERVRGTRVLVVEPCAAVRQALVAACQRLALVPSAAASADEAVALLASGAQGAETARVVLVSAGTPGYEELPARGQDAACDASWVLLAEPARRPALDAAIAQGFAATVAKPPLSSRLADAVARALLRDDGSSARSETGMHARIAMRVLVVEDDQVNQMLARAVLLQEGIQADLANDGQEALEALARGRYHAVLMDLLMPVMDGYACAREIRRRERERGLPPLPILAVSAVDDQEVQQRCLAAGMDGHLRKPFEPRHLRRMLRRLIRERGVAGEGRSLAG